MLGACYSTPKETTTGLSAADATRIATDAYVYGYSLTLRKSLAYR
jgi:hypothetical protein